MSHVPIQANSHHFGKYGSAGKLTALLSLSVFNLNKTPGSVAVSIDLAASSCKEHSMTIALDSVKSALRKRRNRCVLFAQVARTESARTFWVGKLTQTKRASVMVALANAFDPRFKIYEDTDDMALFFE